MLFGLHKTLQDLAAFRNLQTAPVICDEVRGIWLHGAPGAGKTWAALHEYGGQPFMKAQNKWWDGYQGEKVILMDDVDYMGGQCLGHYLKIWGDKYPFPAEIKGGTVFPDYTHFIVTSNYTIKELFEQQPGKEQPGAAMMVKAIERRFRQIRVQRHPEAPKPIANLNLLLKQPEEKKQPKAKAILGKRAAAEEKAKAQMALYDIEMSGHQRQPIGYRGSHDDEGDEDEEGSLYDNLSEIRAALSDKAT